MGQYAYLLLCTVIYLKQKNKTKENEKCQQQNNRYVEFNKLTQQKTTRKNKMKKKKKILTEKVISFLNMNMLKF